MRLYFRTPIWFKGVNLYTEQPAMPIELQPGDELVVSRRRSKTTKNPDTNQDETTYETTELSRVQLGADARLVVGGGVEDRWIDNKRYIEIRLETRGLGGGS